MDKKKKFDKISEEILQGVGNFKRTVEDLALEVKKTNIPKEKKVLNINGTDTVISLIEDGRVMINFGEINKAETYYTNPPTIQESFHDNRVISAKQEGRDIGYNIANEEWLNKPWYKRLFKK